MTQHQWNKFKQQVGESRRILTRVAREAARQAYDYGADSRTYEPETMLAVLFDTNGGEPMTLYGIKADGGKLWSPLQIDASPPIRMGQVYDAVLDTIALETVTACAWKGHPIYRPRRCKGCKKRDDVPRG